MERRIVTGESQLQEYDANGNPKPVDRLDFAYNYTFGFSYDKVRVVRQRSVTSDPTGQLVITEPGEVMYGDYTVIDAGIDRPPAQAPLKPKAWLPAEHERRKQQKNIPKDITTYTQQLHAAAVKAVSQGRLTNAPSARRIETLLHDLNLFPKIQRRPKHARKTHD
jgi:hypothetical protein